MRIAVLVKQVPDSDDVQMDETTGTMVREGVGAIINPLDLNALEAALDLKRNRGALVSVFSMGPPRTEEALREALSLGADEAHLVSDKAFAGGDTWATALTLAAALRKTGPWDMILAGEKATDGETGQVGPETAALLDVPCSTYVSEMEMGDDSVMVTRSVEDGLERQRLPLPCLLTVLRSLNEPSMPTLSGKKRGRRAKLPVMNADSLDISPEGAGLKGSATRVVKVFYPSLTRDGARYSGKDLDEGVNRLVEELQSRALIQRGERS